ncbi:hypothetical protein NW754_016722 [Fusarium falciforme]|nr:hypothetical protein NW754_016722 [Fusarium falciforme]
MGKVILVTGVSRGIARSEAPLKKLKEKYGDRFFYVVGDITEDSVLKQLANAAVKGHGKIDSLVANAGVLEPVQNVNEIDVNAWKKL